MRLSGNWLLAYSLAETTLFQLLRLMFMTVQRIYWEFNGTAKKLREARLPQNYERSAHVLDIVKVHKFSEANATTLSHFLCTHNRFENPQYIIDNEHITLLMIDDHEAVFCEAKEKGWLRFPDQSPPFLPHSLDVMVFHLYRCHLSHYPLLLHSFIQSSKH